MSTVPEAHDRTHRARRAPSRAPWLIAGVVAAVVGGIAWSLPWLRDPANPWMRTGPTVQVVDAGTGRPVVGARVRAVPPEAEGPPGFLGGPEGRTDARGEAVLPGWTPAKGWALEVGERVDFPAQLADRPPRAPPDLWMRFESIDHVSYDAVTVPVTAWPMPPLRVHRTRMATVEVRAGTRDGPPIADVMISDDRDGDAHHVVLGRTDEHGLCRVPLPPAGALPVSASWMWAPLSLRDAPTRGTLDPAHPTLTLVAAPRRAIRLRIEGAPEGTRWTTSCRPVGRGFEVGETRSERAGEAIVDPNDLTGRFDVDDPAGRFDAYVDGGDEAGRAIVRDLACPSTQALVPARGPRIRVTLKGADPRRPYAAHAESLDWHPKRIAASGAGTATLTFASVPAGRWRVVVARVESDDVGRQELVVDVGDTLSEVTVDVSKE